MVIVRFNKELEQKQQASSIRYFTTVNWSVNVRICREMKDINLVKNCFITNEGTKVNYMSTISPHDDLNQTIVKPQQHRLVIVKVNNLNTLDELRKNVTALIRKSLRF